MPDNPILRRMLDRLYGSLVRGPSLNAKPHNSRQRIDLTLLSQLDDGPGSRALTSLLSDERKITFEANVPMPKDYRQPGWGGKKSTAKKTPEPIEPAQEQEIAEPVQESAEPSLDDASSDTAAEQTERVTDDDALADALAIELPAEPVVEPETEADGVPSAEASDDAAVSVESPDLATPPIAEAEAEAEAEADADVDAKASANADAESAGSSDADDTPGGEDTQISSAPLDTAPQDTELVGRAVTQDDAESTDDIDDDEEAKDESDPADDRRYNAQRTLLTKLRNLSDDAKTYEQDTGVSVLAAGYPILSLPPGTVGGGSKRVLAPIAMVPIELSVRSGARSGVTLKCREHGHDRVKPNAALMAWLERETQQTLPDDLFEDEEGEQPLVELRVLIEAVAKMLNLQGIDIDALVDPGFDVLRPVPRSDAMPQGPAILPSAVMGLYPISNQGLMRDMRQLIASPSLDGPIRPFIDSTASLAVEEHDAADAEATVHQAARRFDQERFVALADPCQAETVRLAHTETGLVIHGPPGTGKSQTITNIIGDFLARGQRVLFVCDKRTALDVVYNRLEHLGLSRLCALIHDPQRDQKDLYMGIRARLEELTDFKTAPRAMSSVLKIDAELQSIHDEMSKVYESLMRESADAPSFHDQVGLWMSIDAPIVSGLDDVLGQSISPDQIDRHRADIEVILSRADAVDLPHNPWFESAGVALQAYLARSPDEIRRQLAGCVEDVRAADASAHEDIPPFDPGIPLADQARVREGLTQSLEWIDQHADESIRLRVQGWGVKETSQKAREVDDAQPTLAVLEQGALNRELWMLVRDKPPSMREIAQQLGDLDAYIDACDALLGFLRFGHKKRGKLVLRSYGLSAGPESAKQLRGFLVGLRARRVLTELHNSLTQAEDSSEVAVDVLPDDALRSGIEAYWKTLVPTSKADEQPALAEPWRRALRSDEGRKRLIDGLRLSKARATQLERVEASLQAIELFNKDWLDQISVAIRSGKRFIQAMTRLDERFDDLENVLRVREGVAALEGPIGKAVQQIAVAGVGAEQGVAALQRAVLGRALRRRVAEDPTLSGLDPQRMDRHITRYMELEHNKRDYVVKAILHLWTERQRDRLLVGTGTRLNKEGASLRNRLFVRGSRAMRLRQVISVGQDMEGGDPLFDMCPVWLASPETVAQVFPRQELFDVVIFDEASQCRLEEALPVLTRGKRVVIAGDPKQLPPTRFFEAAIASSEDDPIVDEQDVFEAQLSEVEDLLAAALNLEVQESYLDVHYRSSNADLIGFSNQQFYNDRLQPIPGHPRNTTATPPIALHRVNGVYEERANPDEARYVVQLIAELLEQGNPPSIGVATFNLVQRDLIAELLDEMAANDSAFARRLGVARDRRSGASFEGLFVKNLENVQGDERDHIIISTGYGPTAEGKFYRRFGPLRQAGGGRRLNVLVTRAREKVHLITSIPRSFYAAAAPLPDGVTPNGAWLLFAYLRYAEHLEVLYDNELKNPSDAMDLPDTGPHVKVRPIEPGSAFAMGLATQLAAQHRITSEAHWGNEGFCIDAALADANGPGGVTLGVLADFNRFRYASDPVAWEVYRTAIFQSQGWDMHRVWSPTYLRDTTRVYNELLEAHGQVIESHADPER